MWPLATAALGVAVPNGSFLYWSFVEYRGVGAEAAARV
jgi:hypothetical protein